MTREEYNSEIQALWKTNYNFHEECRLSIDIKEKYIDSLEQQLAEYKKRIEELEAPKSCDGCLYSPQVGYVDGASACLVCSRFHLISDMFTQKDKQ